MPIDVEDKDHFDELLEENDRVLVDFWASWCQPCKEIAPKYEELSEEHDDLPFLKVEVDNFPDLAKEYSVQGIPTFILFENGEEVRRESGSDPETLKSMAEEASDD